LHDGVAADEPVLGKALAALAAADPTQTYALSLRLLVAEACTSLPQREANARRDAKELLRHRHAGAFGYTAGAGHWDLSNTQYAALGLRAASGLGIANERRVWTQLADAVMDAQRGGGGFGYAASGNDEYASMTAAGIAVLAICREQLATAGRSIPAIDSRLQKAWQWLGKHAAAIGNPGERWCYYFHYGLERAAILCDVGDVDGRDWYRTGGEMLLQQQLGGGGWAGDRRTGRAGGHGEPVDTAFAVLFLRRKFQKGGPVTAPRTIVLSMLHEQSGDADVRSCAEGLLRRGKSAMKDVLAALRDSMPARRRAAALALTGIAGQDFGIDPARDEEHNRDALHRAELWYLRNR
jgi:hypothetical protein